MLSADILSINCQWQPVLVSHGMNSRRKRRRRSNGELPQLYKSRPKTHPIWHNRGTNENFTLPNVKYGAYLQHILQNSLVVVPKFKLFSITYLIGDRLDTYSPSKSPFSKRFNYSAFLFYYWPSASSSRPIPTQPFCVSLACASLPLPYHLYLSVHSAGPLPQLTSAA